MLNLQYQRQFKEAIEVGKNKVLRTQALRLIRDGYDE